MTGLLPFDGKLALVTGSGRGIGRAIALQLARQGADIVVNYFRHREPAEQTAAEIQALGRQTLVVKANIGNLDDLDRLFASISTHFGGLDMLIHNAASGYNRPVMAQRRKGWEWTLNINARAFLFSAQAAVPLMRQRAGGVIVAISSPGAQRVLPDYVVVGASKAAIETITRYLAVELSPENIVVNAVSPGMVLTDALKHFDAVRQSEDIIGHAIRHTPAGRLVRPEEVAEIVCFLCTPAASMIRGQVLVIDGGATLLGPGVVPEDSSTTSA